ncbi:MAG: hypothetical protein JXQ75_06680 [Phycisphaerae bacterium]|nr:hypothetical protein [Phycisphaerae bacterium]
MRKRKMWLAAIGVATCICLCWAITPVIADQPSAASVAPSGKVSTEKATAGEPRLRAAPDTQAKSPLLGKPVKIKRDRKVFTAVPVRPVKPPPTWGELQTPAVAPRDGGPRSGNDTCPADNIGTLAAGAYPAGTITGNTTGMVSDWSDPGSGNFCNYYGGGGPDVIIEFQVPATDWYIFETCGQTTAWDTALQIRTDGACPGNTLVACNGDSITMCPGSPWESELRVNLATSTTYFLIVDGYDTTSYGPFEIQYGTYAPPDGRCCYGYPGTEACIVNDPIECEGLGGIWYAGLNCTAPCDGKCCWDDGSASPACDMWTEQHCDDVGYYWIDDETCTYDPDGFDGPCPAYSAGINPQASQYVVYLPEAGEGNIGDDYVSVCDYGVAPAYYIYIGCSVAGGESRYFDFYDANYEYVDGFVVTPSNPGCWVMWINLEGWGGVLPPTGYVVQYSEVPMSEDINWYSTLIANVGSNDGTKMIVNDEFIPFLSEEDPPAPDIMTNEFFGANGDCLPATQYACCYGVDGKTCTDEYKDDCDTLTGTWYFGKNCGVNFVCPSTCNIKNLQTSTGTGYLNWEMSMQLKILFDPAGSGELGDPGCGAGFGGYPFLVESIEIPSFADAAAFGETGTGTLTFTVDIECPAIPWEPCSGPGYPAIWTSATQTLVADDTGEHWFNVPANVCVGGPFFVSIHWLTWTGAADKVPSVLWDSYPQTYCRQYMGYDIGGGVYSWTDWKCAWTESGGDTGWIDVIVHGEPSDPCTPANCEDADGVRAVYRNTSCSPYSIFGPDMVAGETLIADDMTLAGVRRELEGYTLRVGASGGGTYTVDVWLYDDVDACPGTAIAGTNCTVAGLAADGYLNTVDCSTFAPGIILPNRVWMVVEFDNDNAGWLISDAAELGSTEDRFALWDTTVPGWSSCYWWFGGEPVAGFDATIYCNAGVDGACCLYDPAADCQMMNVVECEAAGGDFYLGEDCSTFYCPPRSMYDIYPSAAAVKVVVGGNLLEIDFNSMCRPSTAIKRDAPPYPFQYGTWPAKTEIDTEIVSMNLVAADGTSMVLNVDEGFDSIGQVTSFVATGDNQNIVSGDSFFDVYVDIDVPGYGRMYNADPIRVEASLLEPNLLAEPGALPPEEHYLFNSTSPCYGDMGAHDGKVNGEDIQGFVDCLVNAGSCDYADMDCSGTVDVNDIPGFVNALLASQCSYCGVELLWRADDTRAGDLVYVDHYLLTEIPGTNAVYDQTVASSSYIAASDVGVDLIRYDDFPVVAEICDIHWVGMPVQIDADGYIIGPCDDCGPFQIRFWNDSTLGGAHRPGKPAWCTYDVDPVGTYVATYYMYGIAYNAYYYSVDLEPCCTAGPAWVSIQGMEETGPPDCIFLWLSSDDGDDPQESCGENPTEGLVCGIAFNLNFCLTGTILADITGGCCLPEGVPPCQAITSQACYDQGGTFLGEGVACSGTACLGACCSYSGACDDTVLESECAALTDSYWWGVGTHCTDADVYCSGACCHRDPTEATLCFVCDETLTQTDCLTTYAAYEPNWSGPATKCDVLAPAPSEQCTEDFASTDLRACCVPSGIGCDWCQLDTTCYECEVELGGSWDPAGFGNVCVLGSCATAPGNGDCGACCDDDTTTCSEAYPTQLDCTNAGGETWYGQEHCIDNPCGY